MESLSYPHPHKVNLCLSILEEHFGDITKDVASVIIKYENANLNQLVRHFNNLPLNLKLSCKQVRQAMLVLQQHNCLIVELPAEADVAGVTAAVAADRLKQKGLLYSVNLDMIINRLRFPKILKVSKSLFGDIGMFILEELMVHGRLHVAQIRNDVKSRLPAKTSADITDKDQESTIQLIFEKMVQKRLIISVTSLDIKKRLNERKERAKQILLNIETKQSATTMPSVTTNATSNNELQSKQRKRKSNELTLENQINDGAKDNIPIELRMMLNLQSQIQTSISATNTQTDEQMNIKSSSGSLVSPPNKVIRAGGRGRGRGRMSTKPSSAPVVPVESASSSSSLNSQSHLSHTIQDTSNNMYSNNDNSKIDCYFSSDLLRPREDALWTIGWEQYFREERHKVIIDLSKDRMENIAGQLVTSILSNSMPTELNATAPLSSAMSLSNIYEKLKNISINGSNNGNNGNGHEKGRNAVISNPSAIELASDPATIDFTTMKKLVDLLCYDATKILQKVPGTEIDKGGASYTVNMAGAITILQRKTLHNIAVEKYGVMSARIIEQLWRVKFLDQQRLGDQLIIPAKECRERVYRLHKDKWVDYMEVSKRPDFAPSNLTYFWFIDTNKLIETVTSSLYKTMLNIRLRKKQVMQMNKSLISFSITTDTERKKLDLVYRSIDRLDIMLLRLDKTLQILNNF